MPFRVINFVVPAISSILYWALCSTGVISNTTLGTLFVLASSYFILLSCWYTYRNLEPHFLYKWFFVTCIGGLLMSGSASLTRNISLSSSYLTFQYRFETSDDSFGLTIVFLIFSLISCILYSVEFRRPKIEPRSVH